MIAMVIATIHENEYVIMNVGNVDVVDLDGIVGHDGKYGYYVEMVNEMD